MANEKKKYSAAEKQAYYMGVGAALGGSTAKGINRTLSSLSPKLKDSYKNGLDEGYKRSMKKNTSKAVAYLVAPKEAPPKPKQGKTSLATKSKLSLERKRKKRENPYNDFDYSPKGRIKGSYNIDGFFEPD